MRSELAILRELVKELNPSLQSYYNCLSCNGTGKTDVPWDDEWGGTHHDYIGPTCKYCKGDRQIITRIGELLEELEKAKLNSPAAIRARKQRLLKLQKSIKLDLEKLNNKR